MKMKEIMRKIIVCNIMSVDGFYEGPGKNVMALFDYRRATYPTDESFDNYNAERLRSSDTLLLGEITYKMFKSYWPSAADDPDATFVTKEISKLNNKIDKVVVSDSLTFEETKPWLNTAIVKGADLNKKINELKQKEGKDILIFGSRTLWNSLMINNLIDELHFIIAPVALGEGTPIFIGQPKLTLHLITSHGWDNSGNVLVRYSVS
jgi:dihydrofolate reductase